MTHIVGKGTDWTRHTWHKKLINDTSAFPVLMPIGASSDQPLKDR